MKTIIRITIICLFLNYVWIGTAQEVDNPREILADNEWFLRKVVIDGEEKPFVPDVDISNVHLLIQDEDSEVDGSMNTSFCEWDMAWYEYLNDNELHVFGWTTMARPGEFTNCGYEGPVPDNRVMPYDYFVTVLYNNYENYDDDYYMSVHYFFTINEIDNERELIITNDNGDQAYFRNTELSVPKSELTRISLYPNPVKDQLMVDNLTGPTDLEIYDLTGKVLFAQTLTDGTTRIDLSFLTEGLYIYQLRDGHRHKTGKLIKN